MKTFKELRDFGIFKLMLNGCNIYDDLTDEKFEYNTSNDTYYTSTKVLASKNLDEVEVTCIGSDPTGELEVPAIWVKVN